MFGQHAIAMGVKLFGDNAALGFGIKTTVALPHNKTGVAFPPNIHYSRYMDKYRAIGALAALAQSTRLDAFRHLVQSGPTGLAAGELARVLGVPQNTLSSHLAILSQAGLVRSERSSRSIVYRADLDRFRDLTLFMLKDCCGGRPEICAPLMADLAPCCPAGLSART